MLTRDKNELFDSAYSEPKHYTKSNKRCASFSLATRGNYILID